MITLSGRHRYSLNLKEFSFILQSYHSRRRIIRRFDFQAKGLKRERERERDLKSTAADRNSATIFHINAIKWKRPFYWCFGNIYGCLCGFFLQMLVLRSWIFRIVSDSASSFFIALRIAGYGFSGISKKLLKKKRDGV